MSENIKISLLTSLCVFGALFLGTLLNVNSLFYASIAAIVTSHASRNNVIMLGLKRLYGTIVGVVVGLFFSFYLPHSIYVYPFGILILVFICSKFLKAPSNMAGIVFMGISVNLGDTVNTFYARFRTFDTAVGVTATIVVTILFNYIEKKIQQHHKIDTKSEDNDEKDNLE